MPQRKGGFPFEAARDLLPMPCDAPVELILAGPKLLPDDAGMSRERRRHSKWRRFVRQNGNYLLVGFLLLLVLAAVAGLVYVMTSGRFLSR